MWEYTEKVQELFMHPRNVGVLPDANAIGEVGSLACGDALKLFLKISPEGIIEDASFQTFGCASAIASSSALTEIIKGMSVEEASKITNKDIAGYLGGLPREKMHCSVMGEEALEAAIRNWKGLPPLPEKEEGKLICKCFAVTDNQIRKVIRENGLTTLAEVTNFTKAGGACGECHEKIYDILQEELGLKRQFELTELQPVTKMSTFKLMQTVIAVINNEIAPELKKEGGNIELADMDANKISVTLSGSAAADEISRESARMLAQKILRAKIDPTVNVVVEA